jgi:flagellum-specific ATP synthase
MLASLIRDVKIYDPRLFEGRVRAVEGVRIEADGPPEALRLGGEVRLGNTEGPRAEVVGFANGRAVLLCCDPAEDLHPGARVIFSGQPGRIRPCEGWLGRVLDAFGDPVDEAGPLPQGTSWRLIRASPPSAHSRARVGGKLELGVRVLDLFTPCAVGQRLGLFAGSGVGKSTLLSMLAEGAKADVIVIGLIGERGREAREFIEDALGAEGLKRSVLVVATSDEPAPKRRRAAWTTLAIAEHFRDQGKSVLCLLDSVTRFALAQREIGLAAGEPPAARGYTPSVFAELPKLLERAGPGKQGSGAITGLFTVLVDGDDHNEPVADAVRGILDGHVVMDRRIAEAGRWPAIDVLKSVSRLSGQLWSKREAGLVRRARRLLALHGDMADLIRLGAYIEGSDAEVDLAMKVKPKLEDLLRQSPNLSKGKEPAAATAWAKLAEIVGEGE